MKGVVKLAGLLGSMVVACGATMEDEDEALEEERGAVTFSPTTEAAYGWSSAGSSGPTLMTPISTSVCFLSDIQGLFRSAGDSVKIQIDPNTWRWMLTGTTDQGSPAGRARCITVSDQSKWSGAYSWNPGDPVVDMGSTTNRACFLIQINGTFNDSNDKVRTWVSGTKWMLDGPSGTSSGGWARCVSSLTEITSAFSVSEGDEISMVTNTSSSGPYACFLTQVNGIMMGSTSGGLHGGAEIRTIPQVGWPFNYSFHSLGSLTTAGGKARCIR